MKSLRELILSESSLQSASELGSISWVSQMRLVDTQLESLNGIEEDIHWSLAPAKQSFLS
jgi:hypothetical protein